MSTVPGRILTRTRRRLRSSTGAAGSAGVLQLAGSPAGAPALGPGRRLSSRALLAGALLCLALGVALYAALSGGSSPAVGGPFSVDHALRAGASTRRPGASTRLPRGSARAHATSHDTKGLSSLPAMAQGPVSEALGAERPAYWARPAAGGFSAASAAQHLRARFYRNGVSFSSGAAQLALSLRAVGYGESLRALPAVAPLAKANRVSYARAGLTESYVNGPLGLEQGFTVPKALSAHPTGPLTLSMALSGNARASLGAGAHSITLSRSGRPELRYSGLSATDARGRVLHSWLQLRGGRLLLRVDTRNALYPLRIDPFVQQGEKLTGGGERGEEGDFAFRVALSPEGTTALIGGPNDNGGLGSAWVFTRSGSTWTQQGAKLTGKEEAGAGEFGQSVALSAEGTTTTAVIGGAGDNEGVGAAWVFTREKEKTTWVQQGPKLTAKEETGKGAFGYSVAVSAEGQYALIGGPRDNTSIGGAWVFLRTGSTWAQQAKLIAKSGEETGAGEFGESVAIAAKEGNYALVGAPSDKEGTGAAWVYLRTGTTWAQQGAKLVAKSGEEVEKASFGYSVAVSAEGTYGLMGAPYEAGGVGAAWVFMRSGTTWTQQGAKLVAKAGEETGAGEFGQSVAIAAKEGNYALFGGPGDKEGAGAAWVFLRSGTTWTEQAKLTGSGESGAGSMGESVAISSEGTTALLGGPNDREGVGAGWVFTRTGTTWAQQGEKLTGSGEVREGELGGHGDFGFSVALSPEGTTALVGGPNDNGTLGAAWVFTRSGSTWTQQGEKLTGKEESGAAEFGRSVALSAEGATTTAVIGGPGDKEGTGAIWVFTREKEKTTWTQQGPKLTGSGETGAGGFGNSVAVSAEGQYALVGGPRDHGAVGGAWVFLRTGTTWAQQGSKLVAKSGEETGAGEFGTSVAIAAKEGNYALIGAPMDKEGIGAAWVFLRTGTTWAQQGAKLVAKSGEETGAGLFGESVAISAEGVYGLMGAPLDKEGTGAGWVFMRSSTTWTQQGAKLVAKSGEETGFGEFGASVAIAAKEGNYALFGAPSDNTGVGAAWVFMRSSTTWTQQGTKLTGTAESGPGHFAQNVALSSEGTTALMGGAKDTKEIGAAWAFTRSGTTWTQQGEKLEGTKEVGPGESGGKGEFGYSVALSSEGSTALIGGRDTLGVGAAWVFTRSGSTWTQQGPRFTGSGATGGGAAFGSSVALSANGSTALIGAPYDSQSTGAAWVFTRTGSTWAQQGGKLTAKAGEEGKEGYFGFSVALSSDGSTALIGGYGANCGCGFYKNVGAAWVFTRSGSTWTQQGEKMVAGEEEEIEEGSFGASVALASEGNVALIGAPGDNKNVGAAWVYTRSGTTWTQQGEKLTGTGESGASEFGVSVALSSKEGNYALIGGDNDKEATGAVWAFKRSGTTWAQQGEKLTAKEEVGGGEFGESLALSSEGTTALIGGPGDNSSVGAVWAFGRTGSAWAQQGAKITGGGESGEGLFGISVSLSSEANTALVGGNGDGNHVGAGWVLVNPAPIAVTGKATAITQTTATLNATVNPNGGTVTECTFEWGTGTEYGKTEKCASLPAPGETKPVAVSANLSGLTANTPYHFRISATNASAQNGKGQDETFVRPPTVVTGNATAITQTAATLNATVNPNGGTVTDCKFEWGTTTGYGKTEKCASLPAPGETKPVAVSANLSGLTAHTEYHFRIVATSNGGTSEGGGTSGGGDETLTTLPNPPTVVTGNATAITQTAATLNATVNPNGGTVTDCKFEWGTTTGYGKTEKCASLPAAGETKPVAVSANLSGLTAHTEYHFRIVATSNGGTSGGGDETLTTLPNPPTVVTGNATAITQTAATLNATVNPNGGTVTDCKFEWGTTTGYGKTEKCASLPAPGETKPVAVSANLSGLTAHTEYHFRIVATSNGGTSGGGDETLTTLPNPPTVVTGNATAITQTAATLNATVNPNGGTVTDCKFEWGTTTGYGKTEKCASLPAAGETKPVAVSANLSGLTAHTEYHFRIVATSNGGTGGGGDEMFTTQSALSAPTAVTGTGSALTASLATVKATVNPNGGEVTKCEFEYGPTMSYGSSVPCAARPGAGTSPVAVSASITGLSGSATYHFRISATNSTGTGTGSDGTFTTPAAGHDHWYRNQARVEEGVKVPYLSWGSISLTSSKGGSATECQGAAAGYVENPSEPAEGEGIQIIQSFDAYSCTNEECEAAGGKLEINSEQLPWPAALSEEVKGTFRLPTAGAQLYVHCRVASLAPTEKAGTGSYSGLEERRSSEYNEPGAFACTTTGAGSLKPKVANGNSGEKPSKIQFSSGAGGELECGAAGKEVDTGSLKILGFQETEILTVKNP